MKMGYKKADKIKTDQLLLYKQFYSKQYGFPVENIDVEYFIAKRKLYENIDFPQKRIQIYNPPAGKPSMNKTAKILNEFVEKAFVNGKRNPDAEYPAYKSGCTYCPFKKRHDLCNPKQRLAV